MNSLTKAAVQGAACGLMIGAVLLIGGRVWRPAAVAAAPAVADEVTARRFAVVDAAGNTQAYLGVPPDAEVKMLAALGLPSDRSPRLVLVDKASRMRAFLNLSPDGNPSLSLFDAEGKVRTVLSLSPDGSPDLSLQDAAGKIRTFLRLSSDGNPSLDLYDVTGETRATLGAVSLEVAKTGEERKRSESSLVLFGKDGKVIWEAP